MKQDIQRIMLAAAKPLFLIFILYMLKIVEVGMHWVSLTWGYILWKNVEFSVF